MLLMTRRGLERRRYHALAVKLLAEDRLRQGEIAELCGVSQPTISRFAADFADEIQRVRDNANAQLSALWIADQAARMEVFKDAAEKLIELMEADLPPKFDVKGMMLTDGQGNPVLDAAGRIEAARELRQTLRSVADELGQSKPKLDLDGQSLRIEIVGVNLDAV